jgi:hypothetical protein
MFYFADKKTANKDAHTLGKAGQVQGFCEGRLYYIEKKIVENWHGRIISSGTRKTEIVERGRK